MLISIHLSRTYLFNSEGRNASKFRKKVVATGTVVSSAIKKNKSL